ncbi:MAG: hypothetical protein ABI651_14390 [Verrucomicrobiota bacterium]
MNVARFFCYSLAVKGISAFSGANHALLLLLLICGEGGLTFPGSPNVSAQEAAELPGPLVLIGGRHQDLRNEIRDAFFELAGGKKAKIVAIPAAVADRADVGLLPGFLVEDRSDPDRFLDAVAANPANVGLMIDAAAAVVIRGKNMSPNGFTRYGNVPGRV